VEIPLLSFALDGLYLVLSILSQEITTITEHPLKNHTLMNSRLLMKLESLTLKS